jgi:hypothetical protein
VRALEPARDLGGAHLRQLEREQSARDQVARGFIHDLAQRLEPGGAREQRLRGFVARTSAGSASHSPVAM